jgi:protein TonB
VVNKGLWLLSFLLALFLHGAVAAGILFWHPGMREIVIYSPSFSVALYSRVPGSKPPVSTRPKPQVIKREKPPIKKPLSPPSKPKPAQKKTWKVKGKGASKKNIPSKEGGSRVKGGSSQAKALLEKALAKVGKEVVMGGMGTGREAIEIQYKKYYDEIWRRVKASWILPEEIVAEGANPLAVVVVRIAKDGSLLDMKLEKSSQNRVFDQSCLRAVKKAAPFPPLPKDYPQRYMELGLRFKPWE